jgi:hypothetical protein
MTVDAGPLSTVIALSSRFWRYSARPLAKRKYG